MAAYDGVCIEFERKNNTTGFSYFQIACKY